MIDEYNKFTCNNCEKEELLLKAIGYPYDKGWRRIHNLIGKVSRQIGEPGHFEVKESDFCTDKCESDFLQKQMAGATETIKLPPLHEQVQSGLSEEEKAKAEEKKVPPLEIIPEPNGVDKALEKMEKI